MRVEGGREGEGGSSLGFQYESEWEMGRWEGKVGGCEEREECMRGMIFFLTAFSVWNTDEEIERESTTRHDRQIRYLNGNNLHRDS